MRQYVSLFEEFISGKDVIKHIESITPDAHDVPDYFLKIIKDSGKNFEVKEVKISDLINADPSLAEYIESGEDRYEDAQGMSQEDIDLPVVVFGNDVFDGYSRISVKYRRGEEYVTAYVAV